MVFVEGGNFLMGNPSGTKEENPLHTVVLSGFHIGKFPVTVAEYRSYCTETGIVMPSPPGWGWEENAPITRINWHDARKYCEWLSHKTGKTYRLPTEAEWEYAANGGKNNSGYLYSGSNNIDEVG